MKKERRRNIENMQIENLDATEIKAALEVVVRGMRNNPLHVSAAVTGPIRADPLAGRPRVSRGFLPEATLSPPLVSRC
jgi:hypothetical protein